jgi:hypothetical protein
MLVKYKETWYEGRGTEAGIKIYPSGALVSAGEVTLPPHISDRNWRGAPKWCTGRFVDKLGMGYWVGGTKILRIPFERFDPASGYEARPLSDIAHLALKWVLFGEAWVFIDRVRADGSIEHEGRDWYEKDLKNMFFNNAPTMDGAQVI